MNQEIVEQTEKSYDGVAQGYDDRHDASTNTQKRFWRILRPFSEYSKSAKSILNIGCGTGRVLEMLQNKNAIGIDISKGMLSFAKKKGFCVARADAHQLPFADCSFDLIVAGNGVFSYLNPEIIYDECFRVLADGGILCLHQYPQKIRHLRQLFSAPKTYTTKKYAIGDFDDYVNLATKSGLRLERKFQWRSLRQWPYVLPIYSPAQFLLTTHWVLKFRKPGTRSNLRKSLTWVCPSCFQDLLNDDTSSWQCSSCDKSYPIYQGFSDFGPIFDDEK